MEIIFAEKRKEGWNTEQYYTLRYLVYADNGVVGSYGVHFGPNIGSIIHPGGAYGASRDYHRPATADDVARRAELDLYNAMDEAEQDAYEKEHGFPTYNLPIGDCEYVGGRAVCDGSSLVEVVLNDDKRAFAIAAMMAG